MSIVVDPLEVFRAKGIPHRRMEDWKYTDLRSVLDAETVEHAEPLEWTISKPAGVDQFDLDDDDYPEEVYRGLYSLSNDGAMDAAARAFDQNIAVLSVSADARIAEPVKLDLTSSGHGLVVLFVNAARR